MSTRQSVRDRHAATDRHVHALRQSIRESRRAFAAHHVPGAFVRLPLTLHFCSPSAQSVLSAQFETATDFNSLLRANTPVSRMMTTYTRRGPGQSYLKSVLAERINSLVEHTDLNLEINPLKVRLSTQNTSSQPDTLHRSTSKWWRKSRKRRARYRTTCRRASHQRSHNRMETFRTLSRRDSPCSWRLPTLSSLPSSTRSRAYRTASGGSASRSEA